MMLSDEVLARGSRVIIRRKNILDAVDDYHWRCDKELAVYDAAIPLKIGFRDYLRKWTFDFQFTDLGQRSFALEDESGRHIGSAMYYNINLDSKEAEIGISISRKEYWGKGYGSDATEKAEAFAKAAISRASATLKKKNLELKNYKLKIKKPKK